MPNWCANLLTIKGHEARLLEFRCVAKVNFPLTRVLD